MRLHENWLRSQGGVLTRRRLLAWGNSDHDLRAALDRGALTTVRNGWFALPGADSDVVAAVRAGGCLSCVSALRRRGVWTTDDRLHIRASGAAQLPRNACRCTIRSLRRVPGTAVDPLPAALLAASRCCDQEGLLVLLDSVANLGLMEADELERLFGAESGRIRSVLSLMEAAESGTETMVRHRLRQRGLRLRTQVVIAGVGRVDLLVGERLVVEVDSIAHHTSREAYTSDRRRDRRLRALGYEVVRLTYHQVLHEWSEVEADIIAVHRRLARRAQPRSAVAWPRQAP